MIRPLIKGFLAVSLALVPGVALALENRSVTLTTGVRISLGEATANLVNFAAGSIASIATVLFLVGAMFVLASRGKQDQVDKGKKIMIGALMGMAVALGAYGIVRTVYYLLYQ